MEIFPQERFPHILFPWFHGGTKISQEKWKSNIGYAHYTATHSYSPTHPEKYVLAISIRNTKTQVLVLILAFMELGLTPMVISSGNYNLIFFLHYFLSILFADDMFHS